MPTVSQIVYPNLRFPKSSAPPSSIPKSTPLPPPPFDLSLVPDFRPEQAFLRSIKPFLNTVPAPHEDASKLKEFSWHDETLEIDWAGLWKLTVRAQVIQPLLFGFTTYFAALIFKTFTLALRNGASGVLGSAFKGRR